eukprot:SAG31_NODE_4670_length_3046_cov_1.967424_2_plen_171_part_00
MPNKHGLKKAGRIYLSCQLFRLPRNPEQSSTAADVEPHIFVSLPVALRRAINTGARPLSVSHNGFFGDRKLVDHTILELKSKVGELLDPKIQPEFRQTLTKYLGTFDSNMFVKGRNVSEERWELFFHGKALQDERTLKSYWKPGRKEQRPTCRLQLVRSILPVVQLLHEN